MFSVDFKDEQKEFDGLSRCSLTGRDWKLQNDALLVNLDKGVNDYFLLYSGPYYSRDYHAETSLKPLSGESHLLVFRSIGAERGYFFGLHGKNTVALLKKDSTVNVLREISYNWELGKKYAISIDIRGKKIDCFIDNKRIFSFTDEGAFSDGMVGLGKLGAGKTEFYRLSFREFQDT